MTDLFTSASERCQISYQIYSGKKLLNFLLMLMALKTDSAIKPQFQ